MAAIIATRMNIVIPHLHANAPRMASQTAQKLESAHHYASVTGIAADGL
jgi:hypothetical protein